MTAAPATFMIDLPGAPKTRLGRPFFVSLVSHLFLLLLIPPMIEMSTLKPPTPVKVLEISVMGKDDLSLKGTAADFNVGPLEKADAESQPAKANGPVVTGNTRRMAKALAPRRAAARHAAAAPAVLMPKGPIFDAIGAAGAGRGGIGREKIYLAASSVRAAQAAGSAKPAEVQGMVGVEGAAIDLKAKRGLGGTGNGTGDYITGGKGSVNGVSALSRRGEPILAEYPPATPALISHAKEQVDLPAPDDGDFFSITGPLGHRKIVRMKVPKYPRWAEERGVEAQVAVHLTVTPAGKVKPNLYVENTSGFPELDRLVVDALRGVVFVPLDTLDAIKEEWGVATFNFRLRRMARKD